MALIIMTETFDITIQYPISPNKEVFMAYIPYALWMVFLEPTYAQSLLDACSADGTGAHRFDPRRRQQKARC